MLQRLADSFYPVSAKACVLGALAVSILSACGGSDGNVSPNTAPALPVATESFAIGGTISGLRGTGLVLRNNGGDDLPRSADGDFTFPTAIARGAQYSVVVASQPVGQTCSAANAGGTVSDHAVTNIQVSCADSGYRVSGTITGLGSGKLVLQNNGGDELVLTADGSFSFSQPVATQTDFAVTVRTNPLWQICTVDRGRGTSTVDVSDVRVACAAAVPQVSTFAGTGTPGYADGPANVAQFLRAMALALDADGTVYVADSDNHRIRKITPAGDVTTLSGSGVAGHDDGIGTSASFSSPRGIAVGGDGNIYVADTMNHAIRKITPTGSVSTLAGSLASGSADGAGAAASFRFPGGLAVDAAGYVYVADTNNHKIRKITPAGNVTTLAGSGAPSFADGVGAAAGFRSPAGIVVDPNGNVYVGDTSNHRIRKITPSGEVSTFAGTGSNGSTDGAGAVAALSYPTGLALDGSGALYVAESVNGKIRKIAPDGQVKTLAGSGVLGSTDGIGAAATFQSPRDVDVDSNGNVYVADYYNYKIRKIAPVSAP